MKYKNLIISTLLCVSLNDSVSFIPTEFATKGINSEGRYTSSLSPSPFTYEQSTRMYTRSFNHNNDNDNTFFSKINQNKKVSIPKVTKINGLDEYLDFLKESDDNLVVIEFYAAWCKSCHKFGMKYKHLASLHGDKVDGKDNVIQKGKVRFAQVEYGANVRLCRTFGVKKLPFLQIYKAPLGKITEFVCGPGNFNEKVKSRVESYLTMSDDEIKFERDMEDGKVLGDNLLLGDINVKEQKKVDITENSNN